MDQRDYILEKFPFSDILEEHAEVAAILWEQRALAAQRPNHDAASLKKLDRRIDSHLEGLRLEPEISQFFVTSALNDYGGAGETFVAAICALESGNSGLVNQALEHITDNEVTAKGFISALAWLPSELSRHWITILERSDNPLQNAIALAACGAMRIDPGDKLRAVLLSSADANDELLLARALRLAGEQRRHDLADLVRDVSIAKGSTQSVYQWANWSAIMLGMPPNLEQMTNLITAEDHCRDLIVDTLFRFSSIEAARKCIAELVNADRTRLAIRACCALGDPQCLDWIIGLAHQPAFARIASYAFYTITGLIVPEAKEPHNWVDLIEESDDDFFLECNDYDSALPWPKVDDLVKIWSQNQSMYTSGQRYFLGSAIEQSFLQRVYKHGNQHHRLAAALELANLCPRAPLLTPYARAV